MRILRTMALVLVALMQLLGRPRLVHAADPAAVVVQVQGAVQIQTLGRQPSAATIGMHLQPGDRVFVPAGGRAVLLYRTGKMQTVTAPFTVPGSGGTQSSGLFSRTVQTLSVVATTDARAHPNRQGMIRPIAGSAVPISPRNEIKVLDARPTLVWFRIQGAPSYIVQLRRVDSACANGSASLAFCRPVRYPAVRDTSFSLPSREAPLVRGAVYEWAVAPTSGGRVSETQRFKVASNHEADAISARLHDLRSAGFDPQTNGSFLAALAFRDAQLYYEARHALNRIDPSARNGRAYHQVRAEVLDALGDLDGAAREFSEADASRGT